MHGFVKEKPEEIWNLISPDLINNTSKTQFIHNWLSDQFSFSQTKDLFKIFPQSLLMTWVDQDPSERSILLSKIMPVSLDKDNVMIVEEILSKYGHLEKVRIEITNNFLRGSFSGSLVKHYQEKQKNRFVSIFFDFTAVVLKLFMVELVVWCILWCKGIYQLQPNICSWSGSLARSFRE